MRNVDRLPSSSVSPRVPSSRIGGYPGAERRSTRDSADVDVLDEGMGDSLDYQRTGVSKESFQAAAKGAFGAEVIAGLLRRQQQSDHDRTDDGSAPQLSNGKRKSSVRVDGPSSQLSEPLREAHPSPGDTRAVAVQTDPERVFARDAAAPTPVSGEALNRTTGCQTSGALSPATLAVSEEVTRLQRRSTAPGDIFSHSRDGRLSTSPSAGFTGFGGGKRSGTWQNSCGAERDNTLQREGLELGRPASGTANENQAGPISRNAFSVELRSKDAKKSSPTPAEKRDALRSGSGDEGNTPVPPGRGDLVLRQHDLLARGDGGNPQAGDGGRSPGAVDPALEKRRTVDDVTRQLQEILREDALQDDGGCEPPEY